MLVNKVFDWVKKTTFEGTILKEVGHVEDCTGSPPVVNKKLWVESFRLRSMPSLPTVRLNFVFKAPVAYQTLPVFLSTKEARRLIELIEEAIQESEQVNHDI